MGGGISGRPGNAVFFFNVGLMLAPGYLLNFSDPLHVTPPIHVHTCGPECAWMPPEVPPVINFTYGRVEGGWKLSGEMWTASEGEGSASDAVKRWWSDA